jgi:hypothetical protein
MEAMDSEMPKTSIRPPSRAPLAVLVLAVVAAGGGALYWLLGGAPSPAPTGVAAPAGSLGAPAPATGPLLDEAKQRSLVDSISTNPLVRRLVAEGDLVRRWAVVTENVAGDVVPRKPLSALAPAEKFSVVRRGGAIFIDPRSYQRYDAIGDAVASLEPNAFVHAYTALRPALETAYRGLGYPDGSIDRVTARALARIERTAVRDGDAELTEGPGATYAYADPKLEQLGDVEKQLLRMGPRNGRILQEKAREISRLLGFPTSGP